MLHVCSVISFPSVYRDLYLFDSVLNVVLVSIEELAFAIEVVFDSA